MKRIPSVSLRGGADAVARRRPPRPRGASAVGAGLLPHPVRPRARAAGGGVLPTRRAGGGLDRLVAFSSFLDFGSARAWRRREAEQGCEA
jgi:hypothetical protein